MNTPMILPWLARKWGVSDNRALELWRQACHEAEIATGETGTSEYWGFAKSRIIDLLDIEVVNHTPATEVPWVMINLNLMRWAVELRFWLSDMWIRLGRTSHA